MADTALASSILLAALLTALLAALAGLARILVLLTGTLAAALLASALLAAALLLIMPRVVGIVLLLLLVLFGILVFGILVHVLITSKGPRPMTQRRGMPLVPADGGSARAENASRTPDCARFVHNARCLASGLIVSVAGPR
jgi:hypothetical protein